MVERECSPGRESRRHSIGATLFARDRIRRELQLNYSRSIWRPLSCSSK
jgi:hypothetical protein